MLGLDSSGSPAEGLDSSSSSLEEWNPSSPAQLGPDSFDYQCQSDGGFDSSSPTEKSLDSPCPIDPTEKRLDSNRFPMNDELELFRVSSTMVTMDTRSQAHGYRNGLQAALPITISSEHIWSSDHIRSSDQIKSSSDHIKILEQSRSPDHILCLELTRRSTGHGRSSEHNQSSGQVRRSSEQSRRMDHMRGVGHFRSTENIGCGGERMRSGTDQLLGPIRGTAGHNGGTKQYGGTRNLRESEDGRRAQQIQIADSRPEGLYRKKWTFFFIYFAFFVNRCDKQRFENFGAGKDLMSKLIKEYTLKGAASQDF